MNRQSQLNQDIKLLEYLNYKKNGYFVDIGAHNGKSFSNTYLLEKEYGWRGICVEPVLKEYNICKSCRPNSICKNVCIYNRNGEVNFSENKNTMYSGINESLTHLNDRNIITKKECITFNKLLEDCKAPNDIDFLSLDTEGSELEILKSLDHTKYKFKYITVEHNFIKLIRNQIKEFLESKGYSFFAENKWDDIYVLKKQDTF